jgi:hypothetical protein
MVTFAEALAPLAAFAVLFQTAIYALVPRRLRSRLAPLITGFVGAAVVGAAGYLLGFDDIGLTGGSPRIALIAAVTTARSFCDARSGALAWSICVWQTSRDRRPGFTFS